MLCKKLLCLLLYLFWAICNSGKKEKLTWNLRYNIVLGIASGLCYLHEGCQRRIIHRDIKSANILLTEDFEPQVERDSQDARILFYGKSLIIELFYRNIRPLSCFNDWFTCSIFYCIYTHFAFLTFYSWYLKWDWFVQISDFGLSKWLPDQWTHLTVSQFEGTFGCVDIYF